MPAFHYQNGNLPEPAEFRRILREASATYDPVGELLRLEQALRDREERHGVSSVEFYARLRSLSLSWVNRCAGALP